jgi:hypothetical protein
MPGEMMVYRVFYNWITEFVKGIRPQDKAEWFLLGSMLGAIYFYGTNAP